MTNILTAVAVTVATLATVGYAIWAKVQENKMEQERLQAIANNPPPAQQQQPQQYYYAYDPYAQQYNPPPNQYYAPLNPGPYYYEPQRMILKWDRKAGTWVQTYCNQSQLPPDKFYRYIFPQNNQPAQPYPQQPMNMYDNSRRYMTQSGLNRMWVQQNGRPIDENNTMVTPNFAVPGDTVAINDIVNEDRFGHREMVDMHEYEIPAHVDEYNGREYTKVYDYDHSYCEPADYLEKEYYYMQPKQRNVRFNANSINTGNWYNQPFGIPYFRHMYDEDYKNNDEFNRKQRELGVYYTPTQEYRMKGMQMPRILSPQAQKYDKSSLPYVSPNEKYQYMSRMNGNNHLCNAVASFNNVNMNSEQHESKDVYYRFLKPGEPYTCSTNYYKDLPLCVDSTFRMRHQTFYSYLINMSDDQFNEYMRTKDMPKKESTLNECVEYSGHGEVCGPENGGPDLSRFPMLQDRPDPRRKIFIYDAEKDPRPIVKREGVPMSVNQVHQYWVDNGEAGCCGYSYGDPTRPTTPVSTHYMAPKPWEDASYYNALFVDGGGVHFNYQDMLYEIRYRNIYSRPEDDPLTQLCPYDFETRTDLYHWRNAVFKKYKYDPYPFAKSDDIWRDDIQQFQYFKDNNNPNIELAKVAHFRWYRQEKELEAWRRERMTRERKARRDFYIDRCKGIHNMKYCPLDPCEYIPPDYYEDINGNMQKHPAALDNDYWKAMMNCVPGKYYQSNIQTFGYGRQTYDDYDQPAQPAGCVDYFNQGCMWMQDPVTGEFRYMAPPKRMNMPQPIVNSDWKSVWVTPNPVYDISPLVYNNLSNEQYFSIVQQTSMDEASIGDYDMRLNTPEWFDATRFWNNIPGDALLPYEEKKMRKEYPCIIDNRINENMIISEQTMENTAGLPDDPFADVFNLPAWYPNAREINNLLNRMQAPRGFRFTGDPEVDRARLHYFIAKDNKTDLEKITIIDERMRAHLNEPGYSPYKPSKTDGLSDMQKFEILKHNIGPGFSGSDWPELDNVITRTWVFVDDGYDNVYDAWENEYFRKELQRHKSA